MQNEREALDELGVAPDATRKEMRAAFIERVHGVGGASGNRRAYERAVEAARLLGLIGLDEPISVPSTELARQQPATIMQKRDQLELVRLAREEDKLRREETHRAVDEITCLRVNGLKRARRNRAWLSLISGLVGAIIFALRGIGAFDGRSNYADTLLVLGATAAVTLGALVGLATAAAALRVQILEQAFQDAESTLTHRTQMARLLQVLFHPRPEEVSEDQLKDAVAQWLDEAPHTNHGFDLPRLLGAYDKRPIGLRQIAHRLGVNDFTEVLIAAGKGSGILVEVEYLNDEALVVAYQVQVTPRESDGAVSAPATDA